MVVNVLDETDYPPGQVLKGHGVLDVQEQTRKAVRARLDELLQERVAGNVPAIAFVADGPPSATIAQIAARDAVDLIVIASHGRTGLPRFLLGSTAERVARLAPCSVLIVKPRR